MSYTVTFLWKQLLALCFSDLKACLCFKALSEDFPLHLREEAVAPEWLHTYLYQPSITGIWYN